MKKYILLSFLVLLPFIAKAESLVCAENQTIQSVLVTPAVIATPAVTHTEIVIDSSAWTETINHPAVTHTEYRYRDHAWTSWHSWTLTDTAPWWVGSSDKQTKVVTDTEAWTETVDHPEVTHEVSIVDIPEVVGSPAVYADQCVDNPVVSEPAPVTPVVAPAPYPSGKRHCGTPQTPTCEVYFAQMFGSKPLTIEQQLADLLKQVQALLAKVQAMK